MVSELVQLKRNIELKARCADLPGARGAALSLGARAAGTVRQRDTYFCVERGRLKLREIEQGGTFHAELIWYARVDRAESRDSHYRVVPIDPDTAAGVLALLGDSLGTRGSVSKTRELLMWHNVRIHLDTVEDLGTYVEFEAVMSAGQDEKESRKRLSELVKAMNLRPADYEAISYCDLLGI